MSLNSHRALVTIAYEPFYWKWMALGKTDLLMSPVVVPARESAKARSFSYDYDPAPLLGAVMVAVVCAVGLYLGIPVPQY